MCAEQEGGSRERESIKLGCPPPINFLLENVGDSTVME